MELSRYFWMEGKAVVAAAVFALAAYAPAKADRIKHPTAVFAGLDKITGRIISFDVAVDETVQFGSLQLTPRVCYTRPQTEAPNTTGFAEIDEIDPEKKTKRIFSGWMFAASPGLHGVEHPVYDIWLTDCKGGTEVIPSSKSATPEDEPPPDSDIVAKKQPPAQPAKPKRTIKPQAPEDNFARSGAAEPQGRSARQPPKPAQSGGGGFLEQLFGGFGR